MESKSYQLAEETVKKLKLCINDLMWISGNEKERTSYGVHIRWTRLKQHFEVIEAPVKSYNPALLGVLRARLDDEIKGCDNANVEYEEEDVPQVYFAYYLKDYAGIIIDALKKEMPQDEAEYFEDNVR